MRFLDDLPIYIVIVALILNIVIGLNMNIGFTALMIRCIIVTIAFGAFGYLFTGILRNAIDCSRISRKKEQKKGTGENNSTDADSNGSGGTIDLKVPPIEDSELESLKSDDESDFIEMNPAYMKGLSKEEQGEEL